VVLDRIAPAPRSRIVQFNVPPPLELHDAAASFNAILVAVGIGQITIEEGALSTKILETQAEAIGRALQLQARNRTD
jgi:hypothetical protein